MLGSWTRSYCNNSLWMSGARSLFLSMFTTCRSVKDTLESSLFEAQQQLSHLEITKSQLEIQLHTVVQAKEVIQGESLMYFASVVHLQCNAEKWRKWRESPFVLKLKWCKASKYRIVSVGTAFLAIHYVCRGSEVSSIWAGNREMSNEAGTEKHGTTAHSDRRAA